VVVSEAGASVYSASADGTIRQWRIDSPEELVAWATANRYHPPLVCEQEQLYKLPLSHCGQ